MKERELWELIVESLELYYSAREDPTCSAEEMADDVLSHCVAISTSEATFIRECVTGVSRFHNLCEGALQGYCEHCKRNKASKTSMYLIAFILIFRYTELGGERVRELFFRSTSTYRIVEFVEYLLNGDAVASSSLPLWIEHYDDQFLDEFVLGPLKRIASSAQHEVVEWLRMKSDGAVVAVSADNTALDRYRDPAFGYEDGLPPSQEAYRDSQWMVTSPTLDESSQFHALPPAEVRDMIHTIPEPRPPAVNIKLEPPRAKPKKALTVPIGFQFHSRGEPPSALRKPKDAIDDTTRDVPRRPTVAKVMELLNKPVHVQSTVAALRREAHTHQRRKDDETRVILDKEFNPHDSSEYDKWKRDEETRDRQQRDLEIVQRHQDALQSEAKVRQMKFETEVEKRRLNKAAKDQARQVEQRRERDAKLMYERQRVNVQNSREELSNGVKLAALKNVEDKSRQVNEVKLKSDQLREQATAAQHARRLEQNAIIREIRQLETRLRQQRSGILPKVQGSGTASFDPLPKMDFLATLSLEELRNELARVKREKQQQEDSRRTQIKEARSKELDEQSALQQSCLREREKLRKAREASKLQTVAQKDAVRAVQLEVETQRMLSLYDTLEEKRNRQRAEVARAKEEHRQNRNELFLRAEFGTALERERWKQKEQGVMHRVASNQHAFLAGQRG